MTGRAALARAPDTDDLRRPVAAATTREPPSPLSLDEARQHPEAADALQQLAGNQAMTTILEGLGDAPDVQRAPEVDELVGAGPSGGATTPTDASRTAVSADGVGGAVPQVPATGSTSTGAPASADADLLTGSALPGVTPADATGIGTSADGAGALTGGASPQAPATGLTSAGAPASAEGVGTLTGAEPTGAAVPLATATDITGTGAALPSGGAAPLATATDVTGTGAASPTGGAAPATGTTRTGEPAAGGGAGGATGPVPTGRAGAPGAGEAEGGAAPGRGPDTPVSGDADGGPAPGGGADRAEDVDAAGDSTTIDYELAEHQRWAQAGAVVGAAESPERAAFLADVAGRGLITGVGEGFTGAIAMGLGTQMAEHLVPIPGVGLMIGGYFALRGIIDNWDSTVANISAIGQGADFYEQAANTLAGIATIIDLVVNTLNVIGGIAGVISVAMWIITLLTVGVATPLAATITAIAGSTLLAAGIMNGILQASIQPVVAMFRSLHAYKSQGDPRSVMAQGRQVQSATGIMGGQLGGLAGMAVLMAGQEDGQPQRPVEPDAPPPAAGEPPAVVIEPPTAAGGDAPVIGDAPVTAGDAPVTGGDAPVGVPGDGPAPVPEAAAGETGPAADPNDVFGDGEFRWADPHEGGAPADPVEITTTEARMQEMLDLAESGDVRGMHTDEALFDAHGDAAGRRRPGPLGEPRNEFNNLRGRMDLPPDFQGPVHHYRYPISANAAEATSAGNLYATRTGTSAHQDFHSAFGADGAPYRQMEPGFSEPGMQGLFDFANTSPVRDPVTPTTAEATTPVPADAPAVAPDVAPPEPAPVLDAEPPRVRIADDVAPQEPGRRVRVADDGDPAEAQAYEEAVRQQAGESPGRRRYLPLPTSPGREAEEAERRRAERRDGYGRTVGGVLAGALDRGARDAVAGAEEGAVIGSMILPGMGTAAGAEIGGAVGAVTGAVEGALEAADRPPGITIDPATGQGAELVDPHYPNPPGTRQQIAAIRQEIAALDRERVQTRRARTVADRQAQEAADLQAAAAQAREGTQQAARQATDTQEDAAEREGVNQQAQGEQDQAQGAVASYPERAAGLAVLTQPLNAFRSFLYIAEMLPGDVGAEFHRMDDEAAGFQQSLVEVGAQMATTAAEGPAALAGWQAEQQQLVGARAEAQGAQEALDTQSEQAGRIAETAVAAGEQRRQAADRATTHEQETAAQIEQREADAAALAASLSAWADEHREARVQALEETRLRYEALGYRVTVRGA